ncbi:MAG TPA: hypothetical protein PLZ43_05715 [bacterium]|nr:hypothetical protein [bacterium]
MQYFKNRQNPLKGLDENELDAVFFEIINTFGENWLKENTGNPLQTLWKRPDPLSTNELYSLGCALIKMRAVNSDWVDYQVNQIIGKDNNNRKGAFFELTGLSTLNNSFQNVMPAKNSQCGYDGILVFKNNAKIYLSLKNFGISAKHQEFLSEAKSFEHMLVEIIKKRGIIKSNFFAEFSSRYPSKDDWEFLKKDLHRIIKNFRSEESVFTKNGKWHVNIDDRIESGEELHEKYNSYIAKISAPFHKNEELNLYRKIEDACDNLSKFFYTEDKNSTSMVFIHLPFSALLNSCVAEAQNYFKNNPKVPISGIIFYQPIAGLDNTIHHSSHFCVNNKYEIWKRTNNIDKITAEVPVGIAETSLTSKISVQDTKYLFQSGNLFTKSDTNRNGNTVCKGYIRKIASGIFSHSIMKLPNGEELSTSGKFAPKDELLII